MAETPDRLILLTPEQVARYWSHVVKGDPWECWPWDACTTDEGYGKWSVRLTDGRRVTFYAHRLAYALTTGEIPAGQEAAHDVLCSTPACCNPDHLTAKSHWDNLRDQVTRKALALSIGVQTHATAQRP